MFVSLAEGFGLPIVEAAAAGVERFVVSDIAVFRWIAGGAAPYVDSTSEESIAAGLPEAVRSGGGPAGPVDVDPFSWDRSAAVVRSAVEAVAGR